MAIHGFDIAVGMSPEGCSKRVHIFTVASQYVLSQVEIDAILHDKELDSYLFMFGEAQKALTIFHFRKAHVQFSQMFFQEKEQCLARISCQESKADAWLGRRQDYFEQVILCNIEQYCVVLFIE